MPDHSPEAEEIIVGSRKASGGTPPSKSVRIGLERLDRMMNAVGELVINRTGCPDAWRNGTPGRCTEFSKARLIDKVTEFQEKPEFNNILGSSSSQPPSRPQNYPPLASMSGFAPPDSGWPVSESYPFRGGYSSYSHSFDPALAEFSELEMDRYDEFKSSRAR